MQKKKKKKLSDKMNWTMRDKKEDERMILDNMKQTKRH